MKKISNLQKSVSISRSELTAINALLFGGNGVDLSSIIDDLAVGGDREVIKMRVGFTFRGMNGFVADCGQMRFEHNYKNQGYMYIVKGVSHIRHDIEVERFEIKAQLTDSALGNVVYEETGNPVRIGELYLTYEVSECSTMRTVPFEDWERFSDSVDESWVK